MRYLLMILMLSLTLALPIKAQIESSHYIAPVFQEQVRTSEGDTSKFYLYEFYDTTQMGTYTNFWATDSSIVVQPVLMRLQFLANLPVQIRLPEHFGNLQPASYAITGLLEVYILEKGILIKDSYNFEEFVYLECPFPFWRQDGKTVGFTILTMPFKRDGTNHQAVLNVRWEEGQDPRGSIDYFILGPGERELYSVNTALIRATIYSEALNPPEPTEETEEEGKVPFRKT